MSNQPRKHHFVPQFYLAGFTETGSSDGVLFVLDQQQRKTWTRTPKGTAHKRDFHATESMAIEKKLAIVEGQWAKAVHSVIEKEAIPDDDAFDDLMLFIGFMAVRIPRIRSTVSDFIDRVSKKQIHAILSTAEGRASFRKIVEEQGGRRLSDEEFNGLVEFGQSQQYDVDFDQTWHVQEMLRMGIQLAPLLSLRKWSLWTAKDDASDLICSDSPVAPTWASPVHGPFSPAFGTPNTIVSAPINRRMVLVSLLEAELGPRILDERGVASVNAMTGIYANQLYSSTNDFVWLMKDHRVGHAVDLLEAIKNSDSQDS